MLPQVSEPPYQLAVLVGNDYRFSIRARDLPEALAFQTTNSMVGVVTEEEKQDVKHERFTQGESRWQGRLPKSEKCRNSFAHFVAIAKTTKAGRDHLKAHHKGFGL